MWWCCANCTKFLSASRYVHHYAPICYKINDNWHSVSGRDSIHCDRRLDQMRSWICVSLSGVVTGSCRLCHSSEKRISWSAHVPILAEVEHGTQNKVEGRHVVTMTSTVSVLRLLVKPESDWCRNIVVRSWFTCSQSPGLRLDWCTPLLEHSEARATSASSEWLDCKRGLQQTRRPCAGRRTPRTWSQGRTRTSLDEWGQWWR